MQGDPSACLAFAAVAALVVRAVERAGALDDDRPELALSTLRRWVDGEATLEALDEARDAAAGTVCDHRAAAMASRCVLWACRAPTVSGHRADEVREQVLRTARAALYELGASPVEAEARVEQVYREALGAQPPSAGGR